MELGFTAEDEIYTLLREYIINQRQVGDGSGMASNSPDISALTLKILSLYNSDPRVRKFFDDLVI